MILLGLGITFTVFKSKNDEYVETQRILNPNFSNTYSETCHALMITSFVLFVLFTALLSSVIFFKEIKIRLSTQKNQNYEPLLKYNTPDGPITPITPESDAKESYKGERNIEKLKKQNPFNSKSPKS